MEESDMKSWLEKIVLIAKFEGFGNITETNWSALQNSYQITLSWNVVLEAIRIFKDYKTLSKMFPPKLAEEIFDFCNDSRNGIEAQSLDVSELCNMNQSSSSSNETSSTELAITEGKSYLKRRAVPNEENGANDNDSQVGSMETLNSTPSTSALRRDLQKFKRFKSVSVPSWEINLPTSSSSAEAFGNLHSNRNLTNAEWIACLGFANRKGMLPNILGIDFWDRLKSGVKNEVPIAKSANQLKFDFFTNVISNRNSFAGNVIPRLQLRPSDPESLLTIFHEIKNLESISLPIETLVSDGVLSEVLDWESWFHMFIEALFSKVDSYWMASTLDIQQVKKLNVEYFFERVAPKLVGNGALKLQHAINEIALDLEPAIAKENTSGNETNDVCQSIVSYGPNNTSKLPNVIESALKETTLVKNTDIEKDSDFNVKQTNKAKEFNNATNANGIYYFKETINKNKTTNFIDSTNRKDLGPTKQKVHTKNYYKENSSLKGMWFKYSKCTTPASKKTGTKQNRSALKNVFEAVKTIIDNKEGKDYYDDLKNLLDKQEKGDA